MDLELFDTHCDTPFQMFAKKEGICKNTLHVSLEYAKEYKNYLQCMAVWSDCALSDDSAFDRFKEIYAHFADTCNNIDSCVICKNYSDIENAHKNKKAAFVLTVEDARLLGEDISRLDTLRDAGVRILTFQWEGETRIGGGFDTDAPLSDFGRRVALKCAEYGIIPDISHACERTARDIIEIMAANNKSVIATHSNSYAVCPHRRNMTDELYKRLITVGGIVGISLAPQHLSLDSAATSETVFSHIDHYAEQGGIRNICLGCDLDGIGATPQDIRDLSEVGKIAECMLRHNYSEEWVRAVFSENARRFLSRNL